MDAARLACASLILLVPGCLEPRTHDEYRPTASDGGDPGSKISKVMDGFVEPVHLTDAGDGSGRLFIVEQGGRVWISKDGHRESSPFLDISGKVTRASEQGLLSLAFHPQFRTNHRFLIDYTDLAGETVVAEYRVSASDPDRADPQAVRTVLTQDQPFSNHNGGLVLFGPDGFLYVGLGDGGGSGDPMGNGQSRATWLGKILRLDVDHGDPYAIPPDNPFQAPLAKPEIWAYGLRNPWRFSFDRTTNDLWIGDVGQNAWEEVDHEPADSRGGRNYGWNVYEGNHGYQTGFAPDAVAPVAEYSHDEGGCSITGGYVYRGSAVPALAGRYLYGDYCSGILWGLSHSSGSWKAEKLLDTDLSISSFGEDEAGEVYLVDHGGAVYKFTSA